MMTALLKEGYFTVPGGNYGRTHDIATDSQWFLTMMEARART
jgi:hypothetical protein